MSVFEMVKKDLEAQGVPANEIQEVVDKMIEDQNWAAYLRATGQG